MENLLLQYGYVTIFLMVAIESMGVPVPGETILITAAVYAGTTHKLNIVSVILVASLGAIIGDNLGFWIGREIGFPADLLGFFEFGLLFLPESTI